MMRYRRFLGFVFLFILFSTVAADRTAKRRELFPRKRPSVETLKARVKNEKQDRFLLENKHRLEQIDGRDMPEDLKRGVKYGYLLQHAAWEERIVRAELELLYGLLLDYAEKHEGKLPETLQQVGDVPELDLGQYRYYPVSATEELHRELILAFPRKLVVFLDGKTVYVIGGNGFQVMDISRYKQLVDEGRVYVPPRVPPMDEDRSKRPKMQLERGMRKMEPQLLALRGDGRIQTLYKSTYAEHLGANNELRRGSDNPVIPGDFIEQLFEPVDDSIYDAYRWRGDPGRDPYGNKIKIGVPRTPLPHEATPSQVLKDGRPQWRRPDIVPASQWRGTPRADVRPELGAYPDIGPATGE